MRSSLGFGIILALSLIACDRGLQSSHSQTVVTSDMSGVKLKIVDPSKMKSLLADDSDNPQDYAIHGRLVGKTEAISSIESGDTACYVRTRDYDLKKGNEITAKVNVGKDQYNGAIRYANFSDFDEAQSSGIAILCLRLNSPVTIESVSGALEGIVEIEK